MLYRLFKRCLNIPYVHVENSGDYATEKIGSTLYVYLEHSNGVEDWQNNLDFLAQERTDENGGYYAHGGFLRVWKSILPYVSRDILDTSFKRIIIVGYSHGAALAVLCHEYAYLNRPDIRENIFGYGFGCPRIVCCQRDEEISRRWENFTVIQNIDDVVTHLPPSAFGFFHVGKMLRIGREGQYSGIDAHRPENIERELRVYEVKNRSYKLF